MTQAMRKRPVDESKAETKALAEAVAVARADQSGVSHEDMRDWLLKVAAGDFKAEPPKAKPL